MKRMVAKPLAWKRDAGIMYANNGYFVVELPIRDCHGGCHWLAFKSFTTHLGFYSSEQAAIDECERHHQVSYVMDMNPDLRALLRFFDSDLGFSDCPLTLKSIVETATQCDAEQSAKDAGDELMTERSEQDETV